jgi:hypothetical protein
MMFSLFSGLPLTDDHPMHPFIIDAEGHFENPARETLNSTTPMRELGGASSCPQSNTESLPTNV